MDKLRQLSKGELVQLVEAFGKGHKGTPIGSALTSFVKEWPSVSTQSPPYKKRKVSRRSCDFTKYSKRHIALHVAYFGEQYRGFAAQDNCDDTVEHHLFKALVKTCLIPDRESAKYQR